MISRLNANRAPSKYQRKTKLACFKCTKAQHEFLVEAALDNRATLGAFIQAAAVAAAERVLGKKCP